MGKLVCSARIENENERKAVMAWVRQVANGGYSEIEDRVTMTYISVNDQEESGRWWGIIHFFEHYPEHSIEGTDA